MSFLFPLLILLGLICLGMPVGFAMFAAGVGSLWWLGVAPLDLIPSLLYHSVDSFTLLAIPFFILAAELLSGGSLINRLFDFAEGLIGKLPGGMGAVAVLGTALLGGIQGSSAADAAAIGKIGTEGMVKQGYKAGFAAALIGSSAGLAILIPPSIAMLIYASLTNASVGRLFFAGIAPGILATLVFIAYIVLRAKHLGWEPPANHGSLTRQDKLQRFRKAFWILMLPVLILAGFYSGFLTASEIGTLTVVYSLILVVYVYKTLSWIELYPVLVSCAKTTIKLFIIIAAAILFSKVLTFLQLPQQLFTAVAAMNLSGWQFLLVASGVLFILGMFMEGAALNVMTTPILQPIAAQLGIDPIHYGVVLVLNIEIALISPPVGLNLFVLTGATGVPLVEMFKHVWPFLLILIGLLLAVIFFPTLSLVVPNLLLGKA